MFGLLTDTPETEVGWGRLANARFARRSFRDMDWTALAAAGLTLTAGVVNAVASASRGSSQSSYPTSYQCPQGYAYNTQTRMCDPVQVQGASFFSNIDPTTLAIGAGLLVLVLTTSR